MRENRAAGSHSEASENRLFGAIDTKHGKLLDDIGGSVLQIVLEAVGSTTVAGGGSPMGHLLIDAALAGLRHRGMTPDRAAIKNLLLLKHEVTPAVISQLTGQRFNGGLGEWYSANEAISGIYKATNLAPLRNLCTAHVNVLAAIQAKIPVINVPPEDISTATFAEINRRAREALRLVRLGDAIPDGEIELGSKVKETIAALVLLNGPHARAYLKRANEEKLMEGAARGGSGQSRGSGKGGKGGSGRGGGRGMGKGEGKGKGGKGGRGGKGGGGGGGSDERDHLGNPICRDFHYRQRCTRTACWFSHLPIASAQSGETAPANE